MGSIILVDPKVTQRYMDYVTLNLPDYEVRFSNYSPGMAVIVLAKRRLAIPVTIEEGQKAMGAAGLLGYKGGFSFRLKCSDTIIGFAHLYLSYAANTPEARRNSKDIKYLLEQKFKDGEPLTSADHVCVFGYLNCGV